MTNLPDIALSIRQPWAWAIITPGVGKDIENRQWSTKFRGSISLHASKGCTRDEYEDFLSTVHQISTTRSFPSGLVLPPLKELDRGGIVGVVDIIDCVTESTSPWFFGDYGFVLANPRPVPFIPVSGRLGFFKWRQT